MIKKAIAICILLAGCAISEPINSDIASMVPTKLAKWQTAIRISAPDEIVKEFKDIAKYVNVQVSKETNTPNVVVDFKPGICNTMVNYGETGITMVYMTIDPNRTGNNKLRCIRHETMHALGVLGHAFIATSIMNYRDKNQGTLTSIDYQALGYLYGR